MSSTTRQVRIALLYNNQPMFVDGYYTPKHEGDRYNDPDLASTFEADKIDFKGVDIMPIVSAEMQTEIEDRCLIIHEDK